MLKSDKTKNYLILFSIYLMGNLLFILNYDAIYWDDYVFVNLSYESLTNLFTMHSGIAGELLSSLHFYMINYLGIFYYRIFTLIIFFLVSIFIYNILERIEELDKNDKFFIVLFVLIAPLNSSKILINVFYYTIATGLFFYAFYLTSKNLENLKFFKRVFILILFFASFLVNSFLVFYLIVLIYIFIKKFNLRSLTLFIKSNIDFILLPIVFFIIKKNYFSPSGNYSGYNQINLNLTEVYDKLIMTFDSSFFGTIESSIYVFVNNLFIGIPLLGVLFLFISKYFKVEKSRFNKKYILMFFLGVFVFTIAAFPYLVVNKLPTFGDWNSRHQLLLPLGFSLILFSLISFLKYINRHLYSLCLSGLIVSFIFMTFDLNYKYYKDALYQDSLVEKFKKSEVIRANNTFFVKNNLRGYLANGRVFRYYDYGGLLIKAFGDQKRLMIDNPKLLDYFKNSGYGPIENSEDWKFENPKYLIVLGVNNEFLLDYKDFYFILYNKLFYYENYKYLVERLVKVEEKVLR